MISLDTSIRDYTIQFWNGKTDRNQSKSTQRNMD